MAKPAVSLDDAEKIQLREKAFAEAAFNRLLLEKGIGREFHNQTQIDLSREAFWQGWWLSFLKDRVEEEN